MIFRARYPGFLEKAMYADHLPGGGAFPRPGPP